MKGEKRPIASCDHDATTTSPNRKKPRLGGEPVDEGADEEWNLLSDLPSVVFSVFSPHWYEILFQFYFLLQIKYCILIFAIYTDNIRPLVMSGVPELCRVRAESARVVEEIERSCRGKSNTTTTGAAWQRCDSPATPSSALSITPSALTSKLESSCFPRSTGASSITSSQARPPMPQSRPKEARRRPCCRWCPTLQRLLGPGSGSARWPI